MSASVTVVKTWGGWNVCHQCCVKLCLFECIIYESALCVCVCVCVCACVQACIWYVCGVCVCAHVCGVYVCALAHAIFPNATKSLQFIFYYFLFYSTSPVNWKFPVDLSRFCFPTQVLYSGKAASLGIKQGGPAPGKWAELPITKSPKIVQVATGHDSAHALMVADDGSVFFVGMAKRGEDGDSGAGRGSRRSCIIGAVKILFLDCHSSSVSDGICISVSSENPLNHVLHLHALTHTKLLLKCSFVLLLAVALLFYFS